jgi:hypothetical protein
MYFKLFSDCTKFKDRNTKSQFCNIRVNSSHVDIIYGNKLKMRGWNSLECHDSRVSFITSCQLVGNLLGVIATCS